MQECESEAIGSAEFSVASAALLRDYDEAQRNGFSDGRRNAVAMDSELHELIVGNLEAADFSTAMMCVLYFQPIDDAPRR